MTEDVTITTELDFQQLVLAVQGIEKKLDELGDSVKKTDSGFSKFQANLVTLSAGLGIAKQTIGFVKDAFGKLGESLKLGGEIQAVQAAFDGFVESGQLSSNTLEGLQVATRGTVDNLTLLKEANKAVVLGLPTEGFEEAAAAAIKLGKAQGVDALGSIQALTEGVGKGSIEILNNIGVIVKAEEANKRFAESNAIVGRELTETERKLAFQQEAYRQISANADQLADVQLNAADAFGAIGVAVENARQAFSSAIVENESLRDTFFQVAESIAAVDIEQLVAEVEPLLAILPTVTQALVDFAQRGLEELNLLRLGSVEIFDQIALAFEEFKTGAIVLSEISKAFTDGTGAINGYKIALEQVRLAQVQSRELALREAKEREKAKKIIDDTIGSQDKLATAIKSVAKETKDAVPPTKEEINALKEKQRAAEQARNELERLSISTFEQVKSSERYEDILEKVKKGLIEKSDLTRFLADNTRELVVVNQDIASTEEALAAAIADSVGAKEDNIEKIAELSSELEILKTRQEDVLKTPKGEGGLLQSILGDFDLAVFEGIGSDIGEAIKRGSIVAAEEFGGDQDLTNAITGIDAEKIGGIGQSNEETRQAAREIGKAVLRYYTAGLSDLIPDSVYDELEQFDPVAQALFGEAAGTTARKAADRFIAETLDGNRLAVVIDGELRKIGDLNFSDNLDGLTGAYTELDSETRRIFDSIGTVAGEVFGLTTDLGINFAAVLSNNLGGSLNNVQLLFKELGLTAEELSEGVVDAFLSADISASEALATLQNIEEVTKDGIPGAVGATDEAFQNLIDSAGRGIAFVDALGDVGAEALEKNSGSLDDLKADLKSSGNFAEDQIDQFFSVLASQGIGTLEDLKNVSNETAIAIGAALEGSAFSFAPLRDELDSISDAINAIPRAKDVTVNVRANVSSEDRELIRSVSGGSGSFQPSSGGTR